MKTLSRQDLEDILYGAAILGTGGGGELSEGFALIDDALSKGKEFIMVSLDEAPQDALVCTPYILGAISALPEEEERRYERLPRISEPSILVAYRRFEQYLGREFYGPSPANLAGQTRPLLSTQPRCPEPTLLTPTQQDVLCLKSPTQLTTSKVCQQRLS